MLIGLLLSLTMLAYGQEEYNKHINNVLKAEIVDSAFVFNTSKNQETTVETTLTYLGISKSGLKVVYATEAYPAAATRHGFLGLFIVDMKGNRYWYGEIDRPKK